MHAVCPPCCADACALPHPRGRPPTQPNQPPAGFSGADLANVVNEAAFLAARSATEAVGLPELVEAVQRTR